jgi:predicted lactoylglutathione lyase
VFDHGTVRVSDHLASEHFYQLILAALGHTISLSGGNFHEWNDLGIAQAREDRPVTRRLHVGFVARSRAGVDAFWRAGTEAGYTSDGEPGLRPQYHDAYYGAFLLDPDQSRVLVIPSPSDARLSRALMILSPSGDCSPSRTRAVLSVCKTDYRTSGSLTRGSRGPPAYRTTVPDRLRDV